MDREWQGIRLFLQLIAMVKSCNLAAYLVGMWPNWSKWSNCLVCGLIDLAKIPPHAGILKKCVSMSQILCPLNINTQLKLFQNLPGTPVGINITEVISKNRRSFKENIQFSLVLVNLRADFKQGPRWNYLEYVIQLVSVILAWFCNLFSSCWNKLWAANYQSPLSGEVFISWWPNWLSS